MITALTPEQAEVVKTYAKAHLLAGPIEWGRHVGPIEDMLGDDLPDRPTCRVMVEIKTIAAAMREQHRNG